MIYRHIYWGLLTVGPDEDNLLTGAVKTKTYFVKIVTPFVYKSREEALADDMEYCFEVLGDTLFIMGQPKALKEADKGGQIPAGCPKVDIVDEKDWSRYRLIRLKKGKGNKHKKPSMKDAYEGRPDRKRWKKIFPIVGSYPIEKVAYSIIALPDVETEGEMPCRYL